MRVWVAVKKSGACKKSKVAVRQYVKQQGKFYQCKQDEPAFTTQLPKTMMATQSYSE